LINNGQGRFTPINPSFLLAEFRRSGRFFVTLRQRFNVARLYFVNRPERKGRAELGEVILDSTAVSSNDGV